MTWNYRVVVHGEGDAEVFAIHEVYYNDSGEIEAWTEDPVSFAGEDLDDLRGSMALALSDTWRGSPLRMKDGKLE